MNLSKNAFKRVHDIFLNSKQKYRSKLMQLSHFVKVISSTLRCTPSNFLVFYRVFQ